MLTDDIASDAAHVYQQIKEGASVYVCGGVNGFGPSIVSTFKTRIFEQAGWFLMLLFCFCLFFLFFFFFVCVFDSVSSFYLFVCFDKGYWCAYSLLFVHTHTHTHTHTQFRQNVQGRSWCCVQELDGLWALPGGFGLRRQCLIQIVISQNYFANENIMIHVYWLL